jgi:2-keto-4-pentenoate hydratase/2-oxohepta-3-ene-1,7-dioic acid hydratase in catechol pathway
MRYARFACRSVAARPAIRRRCPIWTTRMTTRMERWTSCWRRGCRQRGWTTRELYWSVGQMVAHHTSNGCSIEAGDLYGSGTVSADGDDALGSLLEITRAGQQALTLSEGERRTFLEDGDEVVITGRCVRDGLRSIGFGSCAGRILPARAA